MTNQAEAPVPDTRTLQEKLSRETTNVRPQTGSSQAKAVILGSNYYNGLSAIRCLGKAGIHVVAAEYDRSSYGLKSRYVKEFLPLTDYKQDEEQTIEELIAFAAAQETKPVIIPTHDNYLLLLDKYQHKLRPYYLMSLPTQGLAARVVEKDSLYELAVQHGVAVPPTVALDSPSLLERIHSEIAYPLIIKPVDSPAFTAKFRKKAFVCHNDDEFLANKAAVEAAGLACFVQKIIVGDDEQMLLFDTFICQDGSAKHVFTGSKLRQWPINFGASCLMKQRYLPELIPGSLAFLQAIKWRGFAEIEYKRDVRDNKIYLIEINARITNFNACIAACGINVPLLTYQDLTGADLTPAELIIDRDCGIGFVYRYESFLAKRAYLRQGEWDQEHLRAQTRNLHLISALWDQEDPLPVWQFVLNKLTKRFKK